ncbi:MAG: hypothetical protein OEL83_15425 [Desulforhopalus sp.]|nr:hypothetical protein [Desulforhopalus sp.]
MKLNKAVVACQSFRFAKARVGLYVFMSGLALVLLSSCGEMNPKNVNIELEKSAPVEKVTSYTQALLDLGLMSQIYDTGLMKVQSQDIADETGTSVTSGGEIQRNITEIMKSTLNSIGGNVRFIEYNPSYIQNQMVSGYSSFDNKAIPDVVITGGITEFDRGLETRGEGTNADAEVDFRGLPNWLPSKTVGASYGDTSKSGKARITLDFNLKDFQSLAGIPRMSTTNSMDVYKGLKEEEVGITLFGPTFGLKGSIKKVQGRHEAVRVLVQVSMIQMIGKYLALPYWRLMGDDVTPDKAVLDSISETYHRMGREDRVGAAQQWLTLHGYDVSINNRMDSKTVAALQTFDPALGSADPNGISEALFTKLYLTIPVTREALGKRQKMNEYFAKMQKMKEPEERKAAARAEKKAVEAQAPQAVAQKQAPSNGGEVRASQAVQPQEVAQVQAAAEPAAKRGTAQAATIQAPVGTATPTPVAVSPPAAAAAAAAAKPKKFGRQLTAEDW